MARLTGEALKRERKRQKLITAIYMEYKHMNFKKFEKAKAELELLEADMREKGDLR